MYDDGGPKKLIDCEIRTGKNTYRKRNSKLNTAAYHDADGEQVIFLKYAVCKCDEKLFDYEQIIHALEHEYVELACREIVDFYTPVRKGFDKMAMKWHRFDLSHQCEFVYKLVCG